MAGIWVDNTTEEDRQDTSVHFIDGNVEDHRKWNRSAGDIISLACIAVLMFMLALVVSLLR